MQKIAILFTLIPVLLGTSAFGVTHVVRKGESLYQILRSYGVCSKVERDQHLSRVLSENPNLNPTAMMPGTVLNFTLPAGVDNGPLTSHLLKKRVPRCSVTAEFERRWKSTQPNNLVYRMGARETISEVLHRLRIFPKWGPKGTIAQTVLLNPKRVQKNGDLVESDHWIILPVASLPISENYRVLPTKQVLLNSVVARPPALAVNKPTSDSKTRSVATVLTQIETKVDKKPPLTDESGFEITNFSIGALHIIQPQINASTSSMELEWLPRYRLSRTLGLGASVGLSLLNRDTRELFLVSSYSGTIEYLGIRGMRVGIGVGTQVWHGLIDPRLLLSHRIHLTKDGELLPQFLEKLLVSEAYFSVGYLFQTLGSVQLRLGLIFQL